MMLRTSQDAFGAPRAEDAQQAAAGLHGLYHDVLTDARGAVIWDRGWKRNAITGDCKRLLAALLKGDAASAGIQGLLVGRGDPGWDQGATPAPQASQTKLVDPAPWLAPLAALTMDFLDGGDVAATPTNKLQIKATLGPNAPNWPSVSLREFGLAGKLGGATCLINCVTHPVIVKDPSSTLTRTVWLVF